MNYYKIVFFIFVIIILRLYVFAWRIIHQKDYGEYELPRITRYCYTFLLTLAATQAFIWGIIAITPVLH